MNAVEGPKLTYFLRSAPTYRTMATLQEYDQVMKKCLEAIININLGQEAWTQSSLPVKQGGLGIRKATDLALSAFLSSWVAHNVICFDSFLDQKMLER